MKMVMAIIDREEAPRVLEALIIEGYTATFNEGRSGFLRQSKQTLFIGVEAIKVDDVLSIIQRNCRSHVESRESEAEDAEEAPVAASVLRMAPRRSFAEVGSAAVFVWTIDRFETF
ncbi:MAG: cyclic-di-AMP receptor [Anaerolineae bacterium]|nr:cyclic-di-AMP receptor [Anaerolineae bacterium]